MVLEVASVSAGVGIAWTTCNGAYDHTAIDLTGGDHALLDSYSATWQLVYAGPNNQIDLPGASAGLPGIEDNYVSGDDIVLAQRTIPIGGGCGSDNTIWDNWMLNYGGNVVYENMAWSWSTPCYVYQRIYEGTPSFNIWWHDTDLFAVDTNYAQGDPPQIFDVDPECGGFKPDQQRLFLELPQLEVNPESINFTSSSWSGRTIAVSANVSWTAGTNASWLAVTGGSVGLGNGTVTFSVAANEGASVRTGKVVVISDYIIRTCEVVQAGSASRPQAQAGDNFGVLSNQFGFSINWASGQVVVVDACTNLIDPTWSPLQTNVLSNTPTYFSDPIWTNLMGRFYRLRAP